MIKGNVVALAGVSVQRKESRVDQDKAWRQLHEEMAALQDLNARMAQQLQDELDTSSSRGEFRPDLQALIEENDRLCAVCGWVERMSARYNKGRGIQKLEWLGQNEFVCFKVLESLKQWHAREI